MDFVYDLETFGNGSSQKKTDLPDHSASGVSLTLRSLSTSDFSKKLQSLSLLDIAKGSAKGGADSSEVNNDNSVSLSYNAQCLKRARISIDLLDSLGFDYSPLKDSSTNGSLHSNNKTSIDNDDLTDIFLYNSGFDGKSLVEKLTKVLESSDGYDTSTRHSLSILERRIEYELSLENGSKPIREKQPGSFSAVSHFDNLKYLTSTGQTGNLARRNLRGLIEEDLLHQYASQLRTFQKIVRSIESVRPNLGTFTQEYNDLYSSINTSVDNLQDLKKEITSLDKQKKVVDLKKNILLAFKSTFTVTQYEEHLIRFADLNDATAGVDFFNAIDKIRNIQNNCDVLLGMENEKFGMKIMKQMSDLLVSINERITSYVQNNIDYVYSGSNLNFNISKKINLSTFQKCLVYIWQNNRSSFDSIMSDMVESRSRLIANEFINQLKGYSEEVSTSNLKTAYSKANTNKRQSRLFLSSYDTIRFMSDSLAYIHSLLVNEMENSRSFLTFDFISRDENSELENMVGSVVMRIISGLNKPLKGAVESVLRQEAKLPTLVNSYDLLELYSGMFTKLLNPAQKIINDGTMATMKELEIETRERIFFLIKLKLKTLEVEAVEEGLNTTEDGAVLPDWVVDWFAFIDEMFEGYNSNINLDDTNGHIVGLNDHQWNELLALLINRPVELLKSIQNKFKAPEKEKLIWELNCVDYMYNKVEINSSLSSKADYLNSLINQDTNTLIDLEFTGLLKSSSLFDIYNLVNMIFKLDDEFFDVSIYEPILENKLFSVETFQTANQKMEIFLSSYINQNELNGLMSPSIYNKVFFDSAMNFIKFYRKLCLIVNEYLRDKDDNRIKVFQWDEMTIATLLGIEEYYQEHQHFT